MLTQAAPMKHWYHEPWPWLLMAGPITVVVAGLITAYLAVVSNDGLVADDYYKQGLAINQTLSRDAAARSLDYRARVTLAPDFGSVAVVMQDGGQPAGALLLRLAHPGRPALDRALPLTAEGVGAYAAAFPPLTPGRWKVTLEDSAHTWRLVGDILVPGRGSVELSPR